VIATRASLAEDLSASAGLRRGQVVLVHSSLHSVGAASGIVGGVVALVQAFLDVLGPEGTLVVPATTAGNSDPMRWASSRGQAAPEALWNTIRQHLPAFEADITPSERVGIFAETVRRWPGAHRSAHPQTSFAAIGAEAGRLMRGHALECHYGEASPLKVLYDVGASVVLLGVGWSTCSCFHLAEYRLPEPPTRYYECVLRQDGQRRWHRFEGLDLRDDDFGALGADLERTGGVHNGLVGQASVRVVSLPAAVDFAVQWMAQHRRGDADAAPDL
jgi:aminoglycoside 3-N-acetyltransferase